MSERVHTDTASLREGTSPPGARPDRSAERSGNGRPLEPEGSDPLARAIPGPGAIHGPDGWNHSLPRLHEPAAFTLARDRWERLVTTISIPEPVEEVWSALTSPDRVCHWLAQCKGSLCDTDRDTILDFEDGEFFLIRPTRVVPPTQLCYVARWQGIGQATQVSWELQPDAANTSVVVTEEAMNPPWDWQTWNGGGWPGILEQLSAHVRTGSRWRWPWRRMGPYAQIELPVSIYEAWDRLFCPQGLKYWLITMSGELCPGAILPVMMGDASGRLQMKVDDVVQPGQSPPSFLPYVAYRLHRPAWGCELGGRLWLEPAGWGRSLLQAFNHGWEDLPAELQLSERRILAGYWTDAVRRARQMLSMPAAPTAPHNW